MKDDLSSRLLVAVYGTLRRGGPANALMKGGKFVCQDTVKGKLFDLSRFPALKLTDPDPFSVVVDVYEFPDFSAVEEIDRYEGYIPDNPDQSLFRRERVNTLTNELPVHVYEYNLAVPDDALISSGNWITP